MKSVVSATSKETKEENEISADDYEAQPSTSVEPMTMEVSTLFILFELS